MALFFYRMGHILYRCHIPLAPKLLTIAGQLFFGSYVDYRARIGKKTKIAYGGSGVVIHGSAIIGEYCLISPGVVIGGRSGRTAPQIGDWVQIFSNASILGDVSVGDHTIIGSNVVLTYSVPSNSRLVVHKPRHL